VTREMFQTFGDSLTGHGLSFDCDPLGIPKGTSDDDPRKRALIDMANVIYKQGRESCLLSYDERFNLSGAIDALRALSTIVGFPHGDRYQRSADILARLLQEQRDGS